MEGKSCHWELRWESNPTLFLHMVSFHFRCTLVVLFSSFLFLFSPFFAAPAHWFLSPDLFYFLLLFFAVRGRREESNWRNEVKTERKGQERESERDRTNPKQTDFASLLGCSEAGTH